MPIYRQYAHKIRVQGRTPETSERPRNKQTKAFLDSDDAPTLIELGPKDPVDIDGLLATGAIVPYEAPKRAAKANDEPKGEAGGG